MQMKSTTTLILTLAMTLLASASPAQVNSGPDQPETPNVGHTRHHYPHNPSHPTSDDPNRFFTDRDSPVRIPLPKEDDAFSFVIYGDRTSGPDDGVAVLADAVRDTNLLEPDLVMTVGDLVQGYTDAPKWTQEMEEYKAVMNNLLCPWFPVAGNHDVYWRFKGHEQRPEHENDELYEMNFGPLWYAFEHKNNYFIVLYSDEGDPETGVKTFHTPQAQRLSPEQRAFLREALDRGRDADHIFVFLHHPRWLKGEYGDDWDSVHEMLVEAGNVAAVFAGHIHYMRYDGPRDGIEYVSLATTGGESTHSVPQAGYLHHYEVVTVRKNQIALASIPVGAIMDVRDITGDLSVQAQELARTIPEMSPQIRFGDDGSVDTVVTTTITNTTDFPIDFTLSARSWDSRWFFPEDHQHGRLDPGESRTLGFSVLRHPGRLDETFRVPELLLDQDLLTKTFRYSIPTVEMVMPIDPAQLPMPKPSLHETALRTGSNGNEDIALVPSNSFTLPQGPMTLECWFNAERFSSRTGLVCKTEGSDYGFFVNDGRPSFSIRLGDAYTTVRAPETMLRADQWRHIAGVYDGNEVRLYVDGDLVARKPGSGRRKTNDLPLMIGADVNNQGDATSGFSGLIDEVRLSSIARYTGSSFIPHRRVESDPHTILLYHMDGAIGPWLIDDSPNHAHAWIKGGAVIVDD